MYCKQRISHPTQNNENGTRGRTHLSLVPRRRPDRKNAIPDSTGGQVIDNRVTRHGQNRVIVPNGAGDPIRPDTRAPAIAPLAPAGCIEIDDRRRPRVAIHAHAGSNTNAARGRGARQRADEPCGCAARAR